VHLLSLLDLFSQPIWEDTVNCPLALEVCSLVYVSSEVLAV
jgi:hypothetical protein